MSHWGKPSPARRDPESFPPELCKLAPTPPVGDRWLHEVKWDGYRIVATITASKVRLWSRNGIEWTQKVPELVDGVASLRLTSGELDGEMIVPSAAGSDFNRLQARLSAENTAPLLYMLFDAPALSGRDLREQPLVKRKAALESLILQHQHPAISYSRHQIGNGAAMFEQAMREGWEGIVSKKVDSLYRDGARNGDWVKVKARLADEFAVVGYTDPEKSRVGIGALMLAMWHEDRWVYIGRVGTGFSDELLRKLSNQFRGKEVASPTADDQLMENSTRRKAHWLEPTLVAEVFHQGLGGQGLLRHPALKEIRVDKSPDDLKVRAK